MKKLLLVFVLLFISNFSKAGALTRTFNTQELIQKALNMNLQNDKEWLRLGHYYKNRIFSGYKSQADGPKFFLAEDGKTNPESELKATITGLFSNLEHIDDKHSRCGFPARFEYLNRKLGLNIPLYKIDQCTGFSQFEKRLSADSVSVVFSSYYMNNPSSTFGHSFLRMNKKHDPKITTNSELLDYGINYAANDTSSNPVLYAIGGLAGWFQGSYTHVPYYYKVREYNDYEARDLWPYKLNLTTAEVDQLVRHIWELGSTYFYYYFFTKNCSYHILTAIEAAAPRVDITKNLPYWVIPSDTIIVLSQVPGLVQRVDYRPSIRSVFLTRKDSLNVAEETELRRMISEKLTKPSDKFSAPAQTRIVDTLLDYIEYKHTKDLMDKKPEIQSWKQEVLINRANYTTPMEPIVVPTPTVAPHESHGSQRLGLELGYWDSENGAFQRYHLRFALHDLMDSDLGYPRNAQIEFFNAKLISYDNFSKWRLDDWALVSVKSYSPYNFYDRHLSWDLQFGVRTFYDKQCTLCTGAYFNNAWGYSANFSQHVPLNFFALASGEANYADGFEKGSGRAMVGPKVGFIYTGPNLWKVHAEGHYYYNLFQNYRYYETEYGISKGIGKDISIQFKALAHENDLQSSIALYMYR
jgi:hypothetical protein